MVNLFLVTYWYHLAYIRHIYNWELISLGRWVTSDLGFNAPKVHQMYEPAEPPPPHASYSLNTMHVIQGPCTHPHWYCPCVVDKLPDDYGSRKQITAA